MTYLLLFPLMIWIALAVALCIPWHLQPQPFLWVAVGGGVLLWILKHRVAERFFRALFSLCMLCLGAFLQLNERTALNAVTWAEEAQPYRIAHVRHVDERQSTYQVAGEVNGHKVMIALQKDSTHAAPQVGKALLFRARLEQPKHSGNPGDFDYANYLMRQGVAGTAYCTASLWQTSNTESESLPLTVRFLTWRERAVTQLKQHLSGTSLAIITAMTLGDKSMIVPETRTTFSATGASHILALSGLHLSILYALLMLTFGQMVRHRRALYRAVSVVCLVGIWLFVGIAGAPLSLLRAAIMLTIVQLCLLVSLERSSLNHLALAALIILLFSPQSLFDVGFQLSFIAVGAIFMLSLCFQQRAFDWYATPHGPVRRAVQTLGNVLGEMLKVSLAAQLGTMALVAYYFHTVPTYGLLVNIIVIPLTYILLCCTLLFFLLPFAQCFLGIVMHHVLQFMLDFLTGVSMLPAAFFTWHPTPLMVIALYGFMGACLWRAYRRKPTFGAIIAGGLCAGVFGMSLIFAHFRSAEPALWIYNSPKAEAVHVVVNPQEHFLWTHDRHRTEKALSFVAKDYWKTEGLAAPIFLLGDTLLPALSVVKQVMVVGPCTIARVGHRSTYPLPSAAPEKPLNVEVLVLQRGATAPLAQILKYYHPRTIVLDASLSEAHRMMYAQAAQQLAINIHDIKQNGAFQLKIP
ncbi:MAG: ComEC/Rec2 family competence protein [Bacteroidaceae bacterium]|nr:ComEC/Rec2 family competence protein [Bacteroidaceae bacterium]